MKVDCNNSYSLNIKQPSTIYFFNLIIYSGHGVVLEYKETLKIYFEDSCICWYEHHGLLIDQAYEGFIG